MKRVHRIICRREYYCSWLWLFSRNMKYLNVAEKHDAAKTIAGFLSNGASRRREGYSVYNKIFDFEATIKGKPCKMTMTSVSGHLLQLEFPLGYRSWDKIDPKCLFDAPIRKTCIENFEPIKRTLEREIRSCQGLIIWTDCDREGENIGFEIIDVCRTIKSNITVQRAVFSEITAPSVLRALQNLTAPDQKSSNAVDIRTELDLRTGAAITRFQTLRLQRIFPENIADKLISYGSCQIPTLGFVVERYKEIENFISEPFWKIRVTHTIDELTVEFNWDRNRLFHKETCEDYLMLCLENPIAKVENVSAKPKHKFRPIALDTIELEKLCSRKLHLTAKDTMKIAEKLYTKGIISYPRTETNIFSKEIDLKTLVNLQSEHPSWGNFAQRVIEWGPQPRNGNKSDQSHPPIHPTKLVTNLDANEARVYELICRHFLACLSKDAVGRQTTVKITIGGEKFTAIGLCIYETNYLDVYIYEKWGAKEIHKYEEGGTFEPTDISMQEGATTAPALLTEADLITLMAKHEIGTDATHAEHINTIKERGYIGVIEKGSLVPGIFGMALYEGYSAMEVALTQPILRAEFEADLKKICLGEKDPKIVLQEQIIHYKEAYRKITEKVSAMYEKFAFRIQETPNGEAIANMSNTCNNSENHSLPAKELFRCPKCLIGVMVLKRKKNKTDSFLSCLNFPDCKNIIWLPQECKEAIVLDETCQKCGNETRLLKFKFDTNIYKAMFNAPSGWYKTCLHCDLKLQSVFNIQIDDRKSNERTEEPISRTTFQHIRNENVSTLLNPRTGRKSQKKIKTTTSSTVHELPIEEEQSSVRTTAETHNSPIIDRVYDIENETNFPDDDESIFFRDINVEHAQIIWENENYRSSNASGNDASFERIDQPLQTTALTNRTAAQSVCPHCGEPVKEFTVKKDGPNKGRLFYICSKPRPCKYFQWADDASQCPQATTVSSMPSTSEGSSSPRTNNSTTFNNNPNVKCNCNQKAKRSRVNKDGPNSGREYYACAKRSRPCRFFQWAVASDNPTTSSVLMPAQNISTNTRTTEKLPNKRKCGLCRQEGHTRQKCPRKMEFSK